MVQIGSDDFVCPECSKRPSVCTPFIIHRSARRLELCYFVCINCGTCGYSKALTRHIVSAWRKDSVRGVSFQQLCREVYAHLDEIMDHRVHHMGYRRATFRRKKK